jgi:hypothetical protein
MNLMELPTIRRCRARRIFFLAVLLAASMTLFDATAAPNPVLPGVSDAGLFRFNGQYFLMGVGTNGGGGRGVHGRQYPRLRHFPYQRTVQPILVGQLR